MWKPAGRYFTLVGNECPLTRITSSPKVPTRTPDMPESKSDRPEVKLVYTRKTRTPKVNDPVSKSKITVSVPANPKEPSNPAESSVSNVSLLSLDECRSSRLCFGTLILDAPSI